MESMALLCIEWRVVFGSVERLGYQEKIKREEIKKGKVKGEGGGERESRAGQKRTWEDLGEGWKF